MSEYSNYKGTTIKELFEREDWLIKYAYQELKDKALISKIDKSRKQNFELDKFISDLEYIKYLDKFRNAEDHIKWLKQRKNKSFAKILDTFLQVKQKKHKPNPIIKNKKSINHTIKELKDFFRPLKNKRNNTSKLVFRGITNDIEKKSFKIISPQPEFDCKGQLLIAFDKPLEFSVEVEIANNNEDIEIIYPKKDDDEILIAAQTDNYTLDLAHLNLLPGIYYCVLIPNHVDYDEVSISFYIQKHLKP